jgi:hypothetical protein
MTSVADDLAISRQYGRRSNVAFGVLVFAVAAVLALAVWDGLWPPRQSASTSHAGSPG